MMHNEQCQCTECVRARQELPPQPPPRYEGSGGIQVEIVEVKTPTVGLQGLVELPAMAAGATVVGAATLEGPGRTVAILARLNGRTIAIWFDRERNELVARVAENAA